LRILRSMRSILTSNAAKLHFTAFKRAQPTWK
jgi:hypothetical protein